ncbi:hypothetical protein E1A91_A12G203300v1 [Gossypium mustelinum]|uniref:Uncharacterized protein n=1 Tax=Gossypium mustelinum TaxID=34275 RepID=A0A5D2WWK8_GOSMU|nr:hypothetical protein E1A91_A12G203300v1 [Gossypium mustelinum]
MVSRVEEAMRRQQNPNGKKEHLHQQSPAALQKQPSMIQCNKGKTSKFKRSSSNLEEDGSSSAILLLACIACTPSY